MELHIINNAHRRLVVLLDDDMKLIRPVCDFLRFQEQKTDPSTQ